MTIFSEDQLNNLNKDALVIIVASAESAQSDAVPT